MTSATQSLVVGLSSLPKGSKDNAGRGNASEGSSSATPGLELMPASDAFSDTANGSQADAGAHSFEANLEHARTRRTAATSLDQENAQGLHDDVSANADPLPLGEAAARQRTNSSVMVGESNSRRTMLESMSGREQAKPVIPNTDVAVVEDKLDAALAGGDGATHIPSAMDSADQTLEHAGSEVVTEATMESVPRQEIAAPELVSTVESKGAASRSTLEPLSGLATVAPAGSDEQLADTSLAAARPTALSTSEASPSASLLAATDESRVTTVAPGALAGTTATGVVEQGKATTDATNPALATSAEGVSPASDLDAIDPVLGRGVSAVNASASTSPINRAGAEDIDAAIMQPATEQATDGSDATAEGRVTPRVTSDVNTDLRPASRPALSLPTAASGVALASGDVRDGGVRVEGLPAPASPEMPALIGVGAATEAVAAAGSVLPDGDAPDVSRSMPGGSGLAAVDAAAPQLDVTRPWNPFLGSERGIEGAAPPLSTSDSDLASPIAPRTVGLIGDAAEEGMAANVRWMADGGIKDARVNVSPAGLGPLSIHVAMEGDSVSVSIVASQTASRELLDAMVPRLRDQLVSQGHETVHVDVSTGHGGRQNEARDGDFAAGDWAASGETNEMNELDVAAMSSGTARREAPGGQGLIDAWV